jgi:tetratricopeptide (TPR) repeat protein
MRAAAAAFIALVTASTSLMAIELAPLWNFSDPAASEQRFRAALASARGDDLLILQTQIARTYGLRGDFARARQILDGIEPALRTAGAEARVRHALELGRSWASATHPDASQTPDAKERARAAYQRAFELAKGAQLDGLAIDALHMLAFVDTAPAEQLKWDQQALAIVETSSQPAAKAWEASLRNNTGYALHQLGRYDEALAQFQRALVLRERGADAEATRIAHWMVAWTLRALGRADDALAIQLRLERECDAARAPDRHVYAELELLYRARGDADRARAYADKRGALPR